MSKTFYIIDGHAQIYRAYFAPFRDLSTASGEPTKATYVFTQWLMNLAETRKPDYLAMAIDSGDGAVFRRKIFKDYKQNRTPPPDDFFPQERRILQIVGDLGIPIFAQVGFEADDLIATMVKRLADEDVEIALISKDKDLRQLIGPRVRMYDLQTDAFIDAKAMREKCGFGPEQSIEVQTLMGDAIDNVQGIPGVGEKTAAKLISTYGTVENLLQHTADLTPKLKENLETYADRLPISRQLVTLKNDVEMDFDAEKCAFRGLNAAALRPHLEQLGFTSLVKRWGRPEFRRRLRRSRVYSGRWTRRRRRRRFTLRRIATIGWWIRRRNSNPFWRSLRSRSGLRLTPRPMRWGRWRRI